MDSSRWPFDTLGDLLRRVASDEPAAEEIEPEFIAPQSVLPDLAFSPVPSVAVEPVAVEPVVGEQAGVEPVLEPTDAARSAAERLAEDERLRGDLTDAGFAPLLAWATDLVMTSENPDAIRPLVRAISRAASSGDASAVVAAIEPALGSEAAGSLGPAVEAVALDSDPDTNAERLVAALRG